MNQHTPPPPPVTWTLTDSEWKEAMSPGPCCLGFDIAWRVGHQHELSSEDALRSVWHVLSEKQAEVVKLRYVHNLSFSDIGKRIIGIQSGKSVTKERARQIHGTAMRRLKKALLR